MTFIKVTGKVNEDGTLDVKLPAGTPAGEADITIWVESEEDATDKVRWDESFRQSQDLLIRMAKEALAEDEAGLTMDFDPDTDFEKRPS